MPGSALAQIYVSQIINSPVGEYDPTSGAVINANFIAGLVGKTPLLGSGLSGFLSTAFTLRASIFRTSPLTGTSWITKVRSGI